jgi:hypothetical protein
MTVSGFPLHAGLGGVLGALNYTVSLGRPLRGHHRVPAGRGLDSSDGPKGARQLRGVFRV